ncbi:hypothetical protein CHLRE_03g162900v5 [Chlamydomonas reinhardtii]|uniref:Guanylate cyclase domain-containing protein n=1 Tax=Chlamydomonas reinhardtii TaxID=3055 RepID=A0A2K3DWJ0_CHLRE|nr:uncharacterized protein CHLRE_03g162900v5 [Chlamydomonas reinhardtii]PNW84895.1 hypothetical protein CHLRE_03g162900v5 [Chlamydomonas reinhardtii]
MGVFGIKQRRSREARVWTSSGPRCLRLVLALLYLNAYTVCAVHSSKPEEVDDECARAYTATVLQSCSPSGGASSTLGSITLSDTQPPVRLAASGLLSRCGPGLGLSSSAAAAPAAPGNSSARTLRPLRVVGPNSTIFRVLREQAKVYAATTGVPVVFDLLELTAFVAERGRQLLDPNPPNGTHGFDALLAAPTSFGDADIGGKLTDLTYLVLGDRLLGWAGIQASAKASVMYDGRVSAVPFIPAPQMLYYHLDAFTRWNLSVPSTWEEYADLAEAHHGREGLFGSCMLIPGCGSESYVLRLIYGSYVQTQGPSHGMYWDPETLEPLVNTPAMEAALKIWRRLRLLNPTDTAPGNCLRRDYVRGRCLLQIQAGTDFKVGSVSPNSTGWTAMRGRMGIALQPGTTHVLDRQTRQLVPCTRERCPYAYGTSVVNGTALPVNRAITTSTNIVLLNGLAPDVYQFYVYNLFSFLASPAVIGTRGLLTLNNEILPARDDDLDPSNVPLWVKAGYDEGDTQRFLRVHRWMARMDNINADLKIRLTTNVTNAMLAAALAYGSPAANITAASASNVMAALEAVLNRIVAAEGGKEGFAAQYRRAVNWSPQTIDEAPPPPSSSSASRALTLGLAIGIPLGVTALAAVVAAAWVMGRRRGWQQRWRRRGGAAVPGAGSSTTLCVTDIESSTLLWEYLPAECMDAALKLHHRVIRQLLLQHSGYESATEGDSFILAFHRPLDALLFAAEAQQALLDAVWPVQLLQHEPLPEVDPQDDPGAEVALLHRPAQRGPRAAGTPRRHTSKRSMSPQVSALAAAAAVAASASTGGPAAAAATANASTASGPATGTGAGAASAGATSLAALLTGQGSVEPNTMGLLQKAMMSNSGGAGGAGGVSGGAGGRPPSADILQLRGSGVLMSRFSGAGLDGSGPLLGIEGSTHGVGCGGGMGPSGAASPMPLMPPPMSALSPRLRRAAATSSSGSPHAPRSSRGGTPTSAGGAAARRRSVGGMLPGIPATGALSLTLRLAASPAPSAGAATTGAAAGAAAAATAASIARPNSLGGLQLGTALPLDEFRRESSPAASLGENGAAAAAAAAATSGGDGPVVSGSGSYRATAGRIISRLGGPLASAIRTSRAFESRPSLDDSEAVAAAANYNDYGSSPVAHAGGGLGGLAQSPSTQRRGEDFLSKLSMVPAEMATAAAVEAEVEAAAAATAAVAPAAAGIGARAPMALATSPHPGRSPQTSNAQLESPFFSATLQPVPGAPPLFGNTDQEPEPQQQQQRFEVSTIGFEVIPLAASAPVVAVPIPVPTGPARSHMPPTAASEGTSSAPPPPGLASAAMQSGGSGVASSSVEQQHSHLQQQPPLQHPRVAHFAFGPRSAQVSADGTEAGAGAFPALLPAGRLRAPQAGTLIAALKAQYQLLRPGRVFAVPSPLLLSPKNSGPLPVALPPPSFASGEITPAQQPGPSLAISAYAAAAEVPGADLRRMKSRSGITAAAARAGGAAAAGANESRVVVFRGLRVRMGLHSGVPSPGDVSRNTASGRVVFSGYPLRLAKAVSDAAHGGMILFSETVREELRVDGEEDGSGSGGGGGGGNSGGGRGSLQGLSVLWMGRHVLGDGLKDMHLFQAVSRGMLGRLALFPPLRTEAIIRPFTGVLQAPVVTGAVARVTVAGASTLLAWDYQLASFALEMMYDAIIAELESYAAVLSQLPGCSTEPYIVEGAFGLAGRSGGAAAAGGAARGKGAAAGGGAAGGRVSEEFAFAGSSAGRGGGVGGGGAGGAGLGAGQAQGRSTCTGSRHSRSSSSFTGSVIDAAAAALHLPSYHHHHPYTQPPPQQQQQQQRQAARLSTESHRRSGGGGAGGASGSAPAALGSKRGSAATASSSLTAAAVGASSSMAFAVQQAPSSAVLTSEAGGLTGELSMVQPDCASGGVPSTPNLSLAAPPQPPQPPRLGSAPPPRAVSLSSDGRAAGRSNSVGVGGRGGSRAGGGPPAAVAVIDTGAARGVAAPASSAAAGILGPRRSSFDLAPKASGGAAAPARPPLPPAAAVPSASAIFSGKRPTRHGASSGGALAAAKTFSRVTNIGSGLTAAAAAWLGDGAGGGGGTSGGGSGGPGVMTVVFDSAHAAAAWLLLVVDLLPCLDWPAELLSHPLCEDLTFDDAVVVGALDSNADMVALRLQRQQEVRANPQQGAAIAGGTGASTGAGTGAGTGSSSVAAAVQPQPQPQRASSMSKEMQRQEQQQPAAGTAAAAAAIAFGQPHVANVAGAVVAAAAANRTSASGSVSVDIVLPSSAPSALAAPCGASGTALSGATAATRAASGAAIADVTIRNAEDGRGPVGPLAESKLTRPVEEPEPQSQSRQQSSQRTGMAAAADEIAAGATAAVAAAAAAAAAGVGSGGGNTWRAQLPPRSGVVFRGLRAKCAVVYGELGGELPAGLASSGQLAYRGKAWTAAGRVAAKAKAGEVATNAATVALLPPSIAKLVTVKNV